MSIRIQMKPEVQPVEPYAMQCDKPYRVVSTKEGFDQCKVGDIVIRLSANHTNPDFQFILNATTGQMLQCKGRGGDWNREFTCLRAFDVRSILFCEDDEDRPA